MICALILAINCSSVPWSLLDHIAVREETRSKCVMSVVKTSTGLEYYYDDPKTATQLQGDPFLAPEEELDFCIEYRKSKRV